MARTSVIRFFKKNIFVKKQIKNFFPFLSNKIKRLTLRRPFLNKLIRLNYKMFFKSTLQLNKSNSLTRSLVHYRIKQLKKHKL